MVNLSETVVKTKSFQNRVAYYFISIYPFLYGLGHSLAVAPSNSS